MRFVRFFNASLLVSRSVYVRVLMKMTQFNFACFITVHAHLIETELIKLIFIRNRQEKQFRVKT